MKTALRALALGLGLTAGYAVADGLSFDPSHLTNATVTERMAVGNAATLDPLKTVNVKETLTDMGAALTVNYNVFSQLDLNPSSAPGTTFQIGGYEYVSTRAGNAQNFNGVYGLQGIAVSNGSGSIAAMYAGNGYAEHSGSGLVGLLIGWDGGANIYDGSATNLQGLDGYAYIDGDAAVTNAYGVRAYGTDVEGTATVTTNYGVEIEKTTKAAGATVTNNYGLYVDDFSGVGTTIHRNIHSAGASSDNRFDGAVSVGGNISVTGTTAFPVNATRSVNSGYEMYVQNTNAGASAYSQVSAYNDTNKSAAIGAISSGATFLGLAATGYVLGNAAPLLIYTDASNPIVFAPNNTLAARFAPDGSFLIGTTTDDTELLKVSGTAEITGVLTLGANAVLNTPASVTLTNGTGLPISTGVSGLAANIAPFLGTSTSANLKTAVTDETGSGGALVFATSPTITTPILTLEQGTAPAATTEGEIQWDTDDDRIVVGTGAATKTFRAIVTGTVTYDPASLAAATTRTDTITISGVTTAGGAVSCNAGADPATTAGQCVIANMRASAANTVSITWRNTLDAVTACDVASSTWTCSQPQ